MSTREEILQTIESSLSLENEIRRIVSESGAPDGNLESMTQNVVLLMCAKTIEDKLDDVCLTIRALVP